ncbi:MAG: HEAT repeat domain-containing protein [Pirellulales bacterium]|nr:HEAT repeat domain-containing protein [Pirellulales bacterium]
MRWDYARRRWLFINLPGLAVVASLNLLILTGCSGFGRPSPAWMAPPWGKKPVAVDQKSGTQDRHPGIKAPCQRMADLRALAKRASSLPVEEQEKTAQALADEFRGEEDPLIRAEMVRAMKKLPSPEASAALRQAMEDSSIDVRIAACQAWGERTGPEAVELLGQRIGSDTNIDVRLAAARALGETNDQKAVDKLALALDDADPALQYRAVLSLQKITGKQLDNDVNQWRQYVKGETPTPTPPTSVAERFRRLF